MAEQALPFEGLKVVEVATWIAAPVAATILADLGADVIKVEPPGEGDPYRLLPESTLFEDVGVNYTWIMDARNKRSITLNLKSGAGSEVLKRLVEGCDVYITNQPLPVRRSLGLTYEQLAPLNPRMIFASLTAFGERGPERDSAAFDQVAYWARSGMLDLVRSPGSAPAQGLPGMGDHPSGVSLFAAIVTGLYRRQLTGRGGLVHTSLHANGFWSNGCFGSAAIAGMGFEHRRQAQPENDGPQAAMHVLYEASDGRYVQLNMVRTDEQFAALLGAVGLQRLEGDERFATMESRVEHGAVLARHLRDIFVRRPASEWLELLQAAGVPASPVVHVEELAEDEQAIVNDVLMPADEAEVGMPYVINHPLHFGDFKGRGPARPPAVNEHRDEILQELGYSADQIEALLFDGIG